MSFRFVMRYVDVGDAIPTIDDRGNLRVVHADRRRLLVFHERMPGPAPRERLVLRAEDGTTAELLVDPGWLLRDEGNLGEAEMAEVRRHYVTETDADSPGWRVVRKGAVLGESRVVASGFQTERLARIAANALEEAEQP